MSTREIGAKEVMDENDDKIYAESAQNKHSERPHNYHHWPFHRKLAHQASKGWRATTESFLLKEIGGAYPFFDLLSGICFVVGSVFSALEPILLIVGTRLSRNSLDWILMSGVILFTLAKLFVATRGIWTYYNKPPSSHMSILSISAVACFFIGGGLFALALILDQHNQSSDRVASSSLASSFSFMTGGVLFVMDAMPRYQRNNGKDRNTNMNLAGSVGYLMGGTLYTIGNCIAFPQQNVNMLIINAFFVSGGLSFFLGSGCFLVIGFWEIE